MGGRVWARAHIVFSFPYGYYGTVVPVIRTPLQFFFVPYIKSEEIRLLSKQEFNNIHMSDVCCVLFQY